MRTVAIADAILVEEVLSLLLFGHDTAAAAMSWAFVHIFQDRALVERLRAETGEELPLLRACIQESMRLCPVVVHLALEGDRSQDAIEGPKAFAEKRKPVWRGR